MTENPYQPPSAPVHAIGVKSGSREDLRSVAQYQKGIIVCILIYLIAVLAQAVSQMALPAELRILAALGVMVIGIVASVVATVFVFLLAIKVYSVGLGVLLGILTLVPCIGLIVLLIINTKATGVLRQNGIKVGFFGANLSQI